MVNQDTIGKVTDLTLYDGIGTHRLLVQRALQLAKPTALSGALAASVLLYASLVVGRLFDQLLGRAVPPDDRAEPQLAVLDGGHI